MVSMERFLTQMERIVESQAPVDQKMGQINQLIETNASFLGNYHNPGAAIPFKTLAQRISALSHRQLNQELQKKIHATSKLLRSYAQDFKFPKEIMGQIIQAEPSALRQASKETRQQAMEAFRAPLKELKIHTAEEAIRFATKYGAGLTSIDISHILFSEEQLQRFLPLLPKLKTLKAEKCNLNEACVKEIAEVKNLQILDLKDNFIRDEGVTYLSTLPHLRELDVTSCILTEVGVQSLVGLEKLETLNLENNWIGARGAQALATSSTLKQLNLVGTEMGDDGVEALARSKTLNLSTLQLEGNSLTNRAATAIATSSAMQSVEKLDLSSNGITADGFAELAQSPHLKNLKELNLSSNNIQRLAEFSITGLDNLQILNLNFNEMRIEGIEAIAASSTLKHLHTLLLSECWIGDQGAELLANSATLSNLRELNLSKAWIRDEGVKALARSKHLKKLQRLNLSGNVIQEGVGELKRLKNLEELLLNHCAISDAGAKTLSFKKLRRLELQNNRIGDGGAVALARSNLQFLNLEGNDIRDKGALALGSSTIAKITLSAHQLSQLSEIAKMALAESRNLDTGELL